MYQYPGRVLKVIDGDTYDVELDLGFGLTKEARLRLLGIDTHETYHADTQEERQRGYAEKAFVTNWFSSARQGEYPLTVYITEKDAFGRWLANVEDDGDDLGDLLLDKYGEEVRYQP